MDLSVCIVSWNTKDLLDQCLASVYATTTCSFEIIVVDNASSDGSQDMLREKYPEVNLIENLENVGFAGANNQAYAVSKGRFFLLLNSDTLCVHGALDRLVSFLDGRPRAGAVGPILFYPDGSFQYSWARFPTLWQEITGRQDRKIAGVDEVPVTLQSARALAPFETDWVKGCCLLMRRETVDQVGGLDDSIFLYSEETDWCLRCRKLGWDIWIDPSAEVMHIGGQSVKQLSAKWLNHLRRGKVFYFRKHHGLIAALALDWALRLRFTLGRCIKSVRI